MKRRRVDDEIDARKSEEEEMIVQKLSMNRNQSGLGLVVEEPVEQVGSALRYEVVKKNS